jgi:diacylglycerol kinase (ATP)
MNQMELNDRKIVYLVNPVSGTKKKDDLRKLIQAQTEARLISFEIADTNAKGDYGWLQDKIHREQITDVVIAGGDGTINQVVKALKEEPVRFGILPCGSGNGLALAAKIPKNPKKSLEVIFNNHVAPTDAFMVNNHFACMLSGLGFDAQVAHDFAKRETRGLITYTRESLKNYIKATPYQFEITIDGFTFFTEAFFISVANSNQFGNQFTIAPKASLHDGLLDVVIVQKMSKLKLPFAILRQIRGKNKLQQLVDDLQKKPVLYFQASELQIKNIQHAPLHIDGDPADTQPHFHYKVMNNCFPLLVPAN